MARVDRDVYERVTRGGVERRLADTTDPTTMTAPPTHPAPPHDSTSAPPEGAPQGADPSPLWNNAISLAGMFIVTAAIILLLTYGLFSVIAPPANPYVDIIGLMILPGILVVGMTVTPVGIVLKLRTVRRAHPSTRVHWGWPRINLDDPKQRRAVTLFVGLTVLMLPVLGVSGYQGYHFTESAQFCGKTCHAVMEPQYAAYERSPHARVSCAECHIGSGADWFVKAKISGVRQVFAVWFDTYSRPIPPAITELRPARETCEECHWPAKFFGSQMRTRVHYSPDEENTRREVRMMLRIGGADELLGRQEGIHWHMALAGAVQYVAADDGLQDVPWIKFKDHDGKETIYRSDGRPHSEAPPPGIIRTVDCMDCHNRAAHLFRPPYEFVDLYLDAGRMDASLPYLKREAVTLLTRSYASDDEARSVIAEQLAKFYRDQYPQISTLKDKAVAQAADAIHDIYTHSFFPAMKVNWHTYPDNIGHMYSSGCFRCHDGKHVDADGKAISSACDTCHTFFTPVPNMPNTLKEGPFEHSMNMFPHPTLRCNQCHTGGHLPLCRECHQSGEWLEQRGLDKFQRSAPTAPPEVPNNGSGAPSP